MEAWTLDEFPNGFFEEFLVIMSDKYGLIVKLLCWGEKILGIYAIELFEVTADALVVFTFFKMKVNDALNLHL